MTVWLRQADYLGGNFAVVSNFKYRDRSRHSDQIARQRGAARINHQRRAEPHHSLDMAMPLHDHVDRPAELRIHRAREHFVRGLVGRRDRMHEADSHACYLDQVRLAHAIVGLEAIAVPIEAFVAVAERRDHRRNRRQLVEHAVHVHIARVHHEIHPGEHLEDPVGKVLAGFGYMSVRDQADSHYDWLRARSPAEHES